jgi:hypothetical protein
MPRPGASYKPLKRCGLTKGVGELEHRPGADRLTSVADQLTQDGSDQIWAA